MNRRETIQWESLTKLELEHVDLDQRVVDEILSGCPVLAYLGLRGCGGINYMKIQSQSLHSLRISEVYEELEISAPYVRSLSISLFDEMMLRLTNISSLLSADLLFYGFDYARSEKEVSRAKELLEIVQHVERLEIGSEYLEVCTDTLSCL